MKCPICRKPFKPRRKGHVYDKPACRVKAYWKNHRVVKIEKKPRKKPLRMKSKRKVKAVIPADADVGIWKRPAKLGFPVRTAKQTHGFTPYPSTLTPGCVVKP